MTDPKKYPTTGDYINDLTNATIKFIQAVQNQVAKHDYLYNGYLNIPGAPRLTFAEGSTTPDAGPIYNFLAEKIGSEYGYLYALPDPGAIEAKADSMNRMSAAHLHNAPIGSLDEAKSTAGGTDGSGTAAQAAASLPGYAAALSGDLKDWSGATVTAFRASVVDPFPTALLLQTNTMFVLSKSAEAYAASVRQAQNDIVNIFNKAADAVDALSVSGSGNCKLALTILSGVLGFVPALGELTAAANSIYTVVNGSVNFGKDLAPDGGHAESELSGSDIGDVWNKLVAAITKVTHKFSDAETGLAGIVDGYAAALDNQVSIGRDGNGQDVTVMAGSVMRMRVNGAPKTPDVEPA